MSEMGFDFMKLNIFCKAQYVDLIILVLSVNRGIYNDNFECN